MSSVPSSTDSTPGAAGQAGTAADREARLTAILVVGAMVVGAVAQIWIPPGPLTLVAATGMASLVVLALSFIVPGRLRTTLAGFRFTSTLLIALAVFAIIGTLVLQGKPPALYRERYGAFGPIILALRFDDIFHGLPYAGLAALFGAAILASASLRWPVSARRAGFFIAHVGLLVSGAGAAASSVLSTRGRIDLFAGGDVATTVRVTKGGSPTGQVATLPFELKLDQFDLVNYETEYRVGFYAKEKVKRDGRVLEDYRLKTSFDPDTARHRLPGGDSFRLKAIYPDFVALPKVTPIASGGRAAVQVTLGGSTRWFVDGEKATSPDGALAVAFGWKRPPLPSGHPTVVLISGEEGKVIVARADGASEVPLADGLALLGGYVKVGQLLPHAQIDNQFATLSQEWKNPVAVLELTSGGLISEQVVMANQPRGVFVEADKSALVFEKRDKEVKAFRSHVTARKGDTLKRAVVSVNDPLDFAGWTLYQVNYNPEDPTYSGLEAVRDPGVPWVFTGFALICIGVAYMFYVEPRLRGGGIERPAGPSAQA